MRSVFFMGLLITGAFGSGCLGFEDDSASLEQHPPPEASLRVPVIAPVGAPVTIDASASSDAFGITIYVFDFNDGTEPLTATEPIVQHVFARQGLYSVQVTVQNQSGMSAMAAQDIAVRDDYPSEPAFCATAADCVVGDECAGGVCFSTGGDLY